MNTPKQQAAEDRIEALDSLLRGIEISEGEATALGFDDVERALDELGDKVREHLDRARRHANALAGIRNNRDTERPA